MPESLSKKPKVMWPASIEKARYRDFEEKVCKVMGQRWTS